MQAHGLEYRPVTYSPPPAFAAVLVAGLRAFCPFADHLLQSNYERRIMPARRSSQRYGKQKNSSV